MTPQDEFKRYCRWCGNRMIRDGEPYISDYDTRTGEPLYKQKWVCPKEKRSRWAKFFDGNDWHSWTVEEL